MVLNSNEKGDDQWSVSHDDNMRLRSTINVYFPIGQGLAASREKHSVPDGKLVAYKSYF